MTTCIVISIVLSILLWICKK
ncbi:MAG: hypothetical protein FP810_06465 [Desulfocapsa sp.]|nr:hypothetical protein [Desulfocapsa sp.]MBU3946434.1 hypothetical protein [Pseudomonadota bacterium]